LRKKIIKQDRDTDTRKEEEEMEIKSPTFCQHDKFPVNWFARPVSVLKFQHAILDSSVPPPPHCVPFVQQTFKTVQQKSKGMSFIKSFFY
jgi:hypothetical protein